MLCRQGLEGCAGVQIRRGGSSRQESTARACLSSQEIQQLQEIGPGLYISWSLDKIRPWPRGTEVQAGVSTSAPAWASPCSALTGSLPVCLLRVGDPERSNSALTFQSSTFPSWTPVTLTRPPASGSYSGAPRARTPSPASTAPTTRSSSRYALSRCATSCLAVPFAVPEIPALPSLISGSPPEGCIVPSRHSYGAPSVCQALCSSADWTVQRGD